MRIYLTTAYAHSSPLEALLASAACYDGDMHTLVKDPEQADAIVFVESSHYEDDPFYKTLRGHALVRRFRHKCLMYNEQDRPWLVLPGIYVSMPTKHFQHNNMKAFCFLSALNPYIKYVPHDTCFPDLVFSFIGSAKTAPVRRSIARLSCAQVYIEDTSQLSVFVNRQSQKVQDAMKKYADILVRSKFVLCPRGVGTTTYRLFETMQAGRVPVIISDGWVAPEGPDWNTFSIRIAEKDVDKIPAILKEREGDNVKLGALARCAWDTFFSPNVLFHRFCNLCHEVSQTRFESLFGGLASSAHIEMCLRAYLKPLRNLFRKG